MKIGCVILWSLYSSISYCSSTTCNRAIPFELCVPNIKIRQSVLTKTRVDRLDIRMSIHKGIVRTITEYIHKTSAQFDNFSVLSEILNQTILCSIIVGSNALGHF